MTEVKVGQIWQECDPRRERFVRVLRTLPGIGSIEGDAIEVETVDRAEAGQSWQRVKGTRTNTASAARFNGRRGGYKFHEEAKS